MNEWVYPHGTLAADGWDVVVDCAMAGWECTGLRVAQLSHTTPLALGASGVERLVIPLSGSCEVRHSVTDKHSVTNTDSVTTVLEGRSSVFAGPTDVLYLSVGSSLELRGSGRVALAEAPTDLVRPNRYIAKSDVPVELRGAGCASRQVHNFGLPEVLDAGSFIVCELITPSGNWSTYPPHKHDEFIPGHESVLEEIYYFEAAVSRGMDTPVAQLADSGQPFGLFRAYASPVGDIEVNVAVHNGDVVLVPYGYHGPAVAAPGYDLYYLNVMAGPDPDRTWNITDDPTQSWIRSSWHTQQVDPRLPYSESAEGH